MPYKHYEMRMPAITKKLFFGEFWMLFYELFIANIYQTRIGPFIPNNAT